MPIRPENKERYPADWKEIRRRIMARARDEELAKLRANAKPAGDSDPYKRTGDDV